MNVPAALKESVSFSAQTVQNFSNPEKADFFSVLELQESGILPRAQNGKERQE